MLRLKNIIIVAIVILTLGIAWRYYKKYKDSEKLKIGETSLRATKKIENFNDLVDILKNGLLLKGFVEIRNFSGRDYTLNQISLDCFTPKTEKLMAEQTNIIQNNISLKKKQITNIPLEYKIDIMNALSLFKESGVIPEEATLWQVVTHPGQYWSGMDLKKLKMKFKGFIQAEGITLSINEEYLLYE
ncbi:MAG: hypothetical protein ABIJ97_06045 [Bacteroidota bacterium]